MTYEEAIELLKQTSPLKITVSGDIGAGKSTFTKRLAEKLDIPRIYIGQFMREEAAKRGMTLEAFGKLQETDDSIDRMMDAMQKEKSLEITRAVFEGRTSWYFVEEPTVTVFIAVDPNEAAERVWNDKSNPLRDKYNSLEEVKERNESRKQSENKRYENYYQIDAYDRSNFHVVVDTTGTPIEDVFETAVIKIAEHIQNSAKA